MGGATRKTRLFLFFMAINFAGHPLIMAACEAFYQIAHAINLHGIMILIFHLLESIIIQSFMRFNYFSPK